MTGSWCPHDPVAAQEAKIKAAGLLTLWVLAGEAFLSKVDQVRDRFTMKAG